MGTYLGPDVRTDIPRRSASQRIAEGLPRYSKNDLGEEYITLPKIERLYYYIVRNAHPSVVLRPRSLHKYLNGNFPCPSKGTLEENNQFISFFPPNVHLRRRFENTCKIFVGIISIEEPSASHIAPQNLQRIMKLTQAITLNIDKEVAGLYFHCGYDDAKQAKQAREEVKEWMETRLGLEETPPNGLLSKHPASFSQPKPEVSLKRRCAVNQQQLEVPGPSDLVHVQPPPVEKALGSTSLVPTSNEEGAWWSIRKGALHLTGTARKRRVAPAVGMFDIYVSNDAYLFRVSLPGVKSDPGKSTNFLFCSALSLAFVFILYLKCEVEDHKTMRKKYPQLIENRIFCAFHFVPICVLVIQTIYHMEKPTFNKN